MRLYLIRHGQSTNNALEDQRHRSYDPSLTDLGHQQAECVADYLKSAAEFPNGGYTITHLYCSPMKRTLQTAQPIAAALGQAPEIWSEIHEIGGIFLSDDDDNVTGYPGMTRSEISAGFPGYMIPDAISDAGWWGHERGRETPAQFLSRAVTVALALRERAGNDEQILLVTHAAFMDALIKALLNQVPLHPNTLFYAHYNTGITRFDFNDHSFSQVVLHYLNRVEHLSADQRSW